MKGKIIGIIIVIIAIGLIIPINSSNTGSISSSGITYGETTYNNPTYLNIVNNYFSDNSKINLSKTNQTVITAKDVNKISQDISQKTYTKNQILSCAMVDLSNNNDIQVDVDQSKITTVTAEMYKSALNSSGINKGHVIVTSPTTATGESALAGVMKSYETATGKEIPNTLKNAVNKEIYTETSIINDTNADPNKVADTVKEVKNQVSQQNTTDPTTIINIVNNVASNNNINISQEQATDLADSIQQSQSSQNDATNYQDQIINTINSSDAQSLLQQIINTIESFMNSKESNKQYK